ncbi:MAG: hypothetical protein HYV46_02730, partial [candidate division NC10 bacterium]|nr:hypothetical protein [candidate division NC10 bacterium]
MRRLLAAIVALVLVGSLRPVAAADIAAWVYDLPRWSGNQDEVPMAALPPATRQVYASLEDGPRFLLDDEFWAGDIQRLVGALREQHGITV